jgi:hypothetical protein
MWIEGIYWGGVGCVFFCFLTCFGGWGITFLVLAEGPTSFLDSAF